MAVARPSPVPASRFLDRRIALGQGYIPFHEAREAQASRKKDTSELVTFSLPWPGQAGCQRRPAIPETTPTLELLESCGM